MTGWWIGKSSLNNITMLAKTLNSIGLVLNILGVLVVFKYGFPQPTHKEIGTFSPQLMAGAPQWEMPAIEKQDADIRKIKKRYVLMSTLGMILMVLGFAFQLAGTLL
jgi:hypothetical protein